jgi:hypothetical protein
MDARSPKSSKESGAGFFPAPAPGREAQAIPQKESGAGISSGAAIEGSKPVVVEITAG